MLRVIKYVARSLKVIRMCKSLLVFNCNYVSMYRCIAWYRAATNGHSNNMLRRASLECCTQIPAMSVTNLPGPAAHFI